MDHFGPTGQGGQPGQGVTQGGGVARKVAAGKGSGACPRRRPVYSGPRWASSSASRWAYWSGGSDRRSRAICRSASRPARVNRAKGRRPGGSTISIGPRASSVRIAVRSSLGWPCWGPVAQRCSQMPSSSGSVCPPRARNSARIRRRSAAVNGTLAGSRSARGGRGGSAEGGSLVEGRRPYGRDRADGAGRIAPAEIGPGAGGGGSANDESIPASIHALKVAQRKYGRVQAGGSRKAVTRRGFRPKPRGSASRATSRHARAQRDPPNRGGMPNCQYQYRAASGSIHARVVAQGPPQPQPPDRVCQATA